MILQPSIAKEEILVPVRSSTLTSMTSVSVLTGSSEYRSAIFYNSDELSSYQLQSSHPSHGIHASPTTMSLRPLPASPHALVSGNSPQNGLHDIGHMYSSQVTALFDPRALGFADADSSHNVTSGPDALDQAFSLSHAYF